MRRITGLRVARSFLTPKNEVATAELDFQLGPQMGIEISSVLGLVGFTIDEAADVAMGSPKEGLQTLHLETDTLEDIPIEDAEDEYNVDTEAIWAQAVHVHGVEDDTNGNAAMVVEVNPKDMCHMPSNLVSARNITHRAESADADLTIGFHVWLYYYYVELSNAEMGLFLARRL